ncbi:hypothetical protein MBLNU457_1309t2 [Dothideomycetes sp. NU457]
MQRSVFALARTAPRELIRSTFQPREIQHRALAHVPEDLLLDIPETSSSFSLFEGFNASVEDDLDKKKRHGRHGSKTLKMIEEGKIEGKAGLTQLKDRKKTLDHRLEMMGIRKSMCASEIMELDKKIANINMMRKLAVQKLADLEQEEADLDRETSEIESKVEDLQLEVDAEAQEAERGRTATKMAEEEPKMDTEDTSFMSQSIYEKLPEKAAPPKTPRKRKVSRRVSTPILHQNLTAGSRIKEFQAHSDMITAMDFDVPFGTMVSAALDDTLRVWDLNSSRCIGMLEGHLSSVRCIQVQENIVASGSNDATVRLWDLSQADYSPHISSTINKGQDHDREGPEGDDQDDLFGNSESSAEPTATTSSLADCPLYTLSSHVAEVTALHFDGNTLVSGSADKTLRQWDLETGRCVQTLDVLWAAAQASAVNPSFNASNSNPSTSESASWWRPQSGRLPAAEADFVGALQSFQSAVACGTADSVIRLWDLRSGMVQRSLIGHTGPITALQFDDVHLVTGSADRSIRIWDLRTGSIFDAFAYDSPITSMMFDSRRICAAAGESVVKVYDKVDGHQWDCGPGAALDVQSESPLANVEQVRIKDGYMIEGRKDGVVGVWAC